MKRRRPRFRRGTLNVVIDSVIYTLGETVQTNCSEGVVVDRIFDMEGCPHPSKWFIRVDAYGWLDTDPSWPTDIDKLYVGVEPLTCYA